MRDLLTFKVKVKCDYYCGTVEMEKCDSYSGTEGVDYMIKLIE